MFHMTSLADDRIRDIFETATELRNGREARTSPARFAGLRLRLGTILLDAGMALVSGARPVATSSAGR
jgi:hypothetical protein